MTKEAPEDLPASLGTPTPIRMVAGGVVTSRRAQPGAHTPAAATIANRTEGRRRSVSTEVTLRLSTEVRHGASGASPSDYDLATGGSSRIHGHAAMVLTLPLLFLTTVIFIANS